MSAAKRQRDGFRASTIQGVAERSQITQLRGILSVCINSRGWQGTRNIDPESSQLCPVAEQETVGTKLNTRNFIKI